MAYAPLSESGAMSLPSLSTFEGTKGHAFNIAGGCIWRTMDRAYIKDYYDLLGVPIEEACLQEHPGWYGYYDLRL